MNECVAHLGMRASQLFNKLTIVCVRVVPNFRETPHAALCVHMSATKIRQGFATEIQFGCNAVKWKEMDLEWNTRKVTIIIPNLHFMLNFLPLFFENWKYNQIQSNTKSIRDQWCQFNVCSFRYVRFLVPLFRFDRLKCRDYYSIQTHFVTVC